jgi:hypothetical protein
MKLILLILLLLPDLTGLIKSEFEFFPPSEKILFTKSKFLPLYLLFFLDMVEKEESLISLIK